MRKILITATIILIGTLLLCGLYLPDTPLMWMASTAPGYVYVRGGLVGVLISLLVTQPPRAYFVRVALGMVALTGGIVTLYLLFTDQLYVADAVVLLEVAIICGLEALESTSPRLVTLLPVGSASK